MEGSNEELGVIKVDGHIAKVTYVGGSVFGINFVDMKDAKPMQARKNVVEKWVRQGSMRLTNATLYNKIIQDIDPETGETPTHHADGTTKTLVERELSDLKSKGLIDPDADETKLKELSKEQDKAKADMAKPQGKPTPETPRMPVTPMPATTEPSVPNAPSTPASMTQMPATKDAPRPIRQISNVHPVTSLDDETFEDPGVDKRTHSRVAIFVIVMLVVALLALVIAYTLSSNAKGFNLPIPTHETQTQSVNEQNAGMANANASASHDGQNRNTDVVVSDGNTITRSDYDPETSVSDKAIADDATRDLASQMFTYIRQCFTDGNVDNYKDAVNIDNIADQVAMSYASQLRQQKPSMTDGEIQQVRDYYKQALVEDEEQHVLDHDPYGSMLGGRIREVRTDGTDSHVIYVVTESLGGDHQRLCFVMKGSDDGTSWVIDSIMDPDAYAKQIMTGDTSKYVTKNDKG